jgi:hypothetical protein
MGRPKKTDHITPKELPKLKRLVKEILATKYSEIKTR